LGKKKKKTKVREVESLATPKKGVWWIPLPAPGWEGVGGENSRFSGQLTINSKELEEMPMEGQLGGIQVAKQAYLPLTEG